MKVCRTCGAEQDSGQFRSGHATCKRCQYLKTTVYRSHNRAKLRRAWREWAAKNPDKVREKRQADYNNHSAERRAKAKLYRLRTAAQKAKEQTL